MSKYIDREVLLAELQEEIDFETPMYTEEQNKYFTMGLKCALRDVKSQPEADVAEVRHGKWELIETEDLLSGGYISRFTCPLCFREVTMCHDNEKDHKIEALYPYCHCGAKMNGERKIENDS